jgi:TolB protein
VDIASGERVAFAQPPSGAEDFALSSDASRIAYVEEDESGHPQVFIMDVAGGPARQLTFEQLAARAPEFSPDGSQIAYRALSDDARYEVSVIDAEGGDPRQITSEEEDVTHTLAWTEDGSILYQTVGTATYPDDGTHVPIVRMIDLASRDATTVVSNAAIADLSPDGGQLAFNTWSRGLVTVANADGSARRVLPPPGGKPTGFGKWSPDGTRLAMIEAGDLNDSRVGLGNGATYVFDLSADSYTFDTEGDLVDWIDDQTILVVVGAP